ncbi:DUF3426 domain-containing protein [Pseudomonas oryzae]|uniref:MJ0042 family finger-like domain-containing protein n=1 Tax=Pseudomonas oryzae TaxID=1392877 RepID=A0A1H1WP65_9PSED|nr:DUF3426 domain-containing protein [Pseudomonas oryzae]SDS98156.1 MJ0042 family finger-like domain-containing protein [Pseudomonas oryzae]
MTESFVTQCPHCQTRFRVTRAQLGMARGAVRCGACMQVFNAAEHLDEAAREARAPASAPQPAAPGAAAAREAVHRAVEAADVRGSLGKALGSAAAGGVTAAATEPPAASSALPKPRETPPPTPPQSREANSASVTPPPPAPAPDDTLWIHDDLDLDNLDLELDDELDKLGPADFELSNEFRDYQPPRSPFAAPEPPREAHDESWAEALLHEPAMTARPAARAAAAPPARVVDEPPLEGASGDEQFPELDDDAEEAERRAPAGLSAERDEPISVSAAAASLGAAATGSATPAARPGEPRLRDEGLLNLADEPLQLDWQPPRTSWLRRLVWLLLILLALAGLAAQYLYYHFDELARQERLRPWLEQACAPLGCTLPPRVDVGLVKSSNLTVRNHPTHPGALTVDAIIYNRADFAQPFPLLELRFEDINGKPLASRRFKPSEYLAGELAGRREMPPQTPIHIALEIIDPGTHAVNYSLAFHSPD